MGQTFIVYQSPPTEAYKESVEIASFKPEGYLLPPPILAPLPVAGPSSAKRVAFGLIRGVGAGLVAFSVIMLVMAFGPSIQKEILYATGRSTIKMINPGFESILVQTEAERINAVQQEAQAYGVDPYYSIVIPKIGAASKVIANVDVSSENDYRQALLHGVAHAKGTFFPGQGKRIYLFAHSTDFSYDVARYNAVFFLLRNMEPGDKIIIFFTDRKYVYQVTDKKIVPANDTSWLTGQSQGEQLVLQTCYPPGTTWERLLVLAKIIGQE